MNTLAYVAAFASLSVASTAQAQDAAKAFQCDLPYRDTMMAMGSLEVLSQTPVKPFPGLHGEGEMIAFGTGKQAVFGLPPESLTLEILQPHSLAARKIFRVIFTSTFVRSEPNDELIKQSVPWHFDLCGLETCYRAEAATPAGGGRLEYSRKAPLAVKCIFEFTPEEFEALGN